VLVEVVEKAIQVLDDHTFEEDRRAAYDQAYQIEKEDSRLTRASLRRVRLHATADDVTHQPHAIALLCLEHAMGMRGRRHSATGDHTDFRSAL
jgi:hypothetical protein